MFASTGAHGLKFYLLSTTASVAFFEPSQPIRTFWCSGVQGRVMTEVRHSDDAVNPAKSETSTWRPFFVFQCWNCCRISTLSFTSFTCSVTFVIMMFIKKISKEDWLCAFVVLFVCGTLVCFKGLINRFRSFIGSTDTQAAQKLCNTTHPERCSWQFFHKGAMFANNHSGAFQYCTRVAG